MDVDRRINGLQKLALLFVPVEYRPKGTTAVESLLEGLGHPVQVDGDLGVHGDEIAPTCIPLGSTETFHRLVNDGGVPALGVVIFKRGGVRFESDSAA